jgi:hypothetical protein
MELAVVAVRLTLVAAHNLLSMEHAVIEPDDGLTVIVGPNAGGKSNMVRLVTLAGLMLEWLEERSSKMPGPETAQPARNALAGYAASRCRSSRSVLSCRWRLAGPRPGRR